MSYQKLQIQLRLQAGSYGLKSSNMIERGSSILGPFVLTTYLLLLFRSEIVGDVESLADFFR
jgi:hypothetical protein